ncbi:FlgD immunoglobulin-like domain containing protein [Candidatus Neomarinimicrobiota bacterium]
MRLTGPVGAMLFVISVMSGQTTSYLPTEPGTRWLYQFSSRIETVAGLSMDGIYFYNDFREIIELDTIDGIPYRQIHSWMADGTTPSFPTYAWYTEDDSGLYEAAYCYNCSTGSMEKSARETGYRVEFGGHRFRSMDELLIRLVTGTVLQNDTIPWLDTARVELRYPLNIGTSWIWFNDPWHAVKTVLGDEWIETPSGQYEAKHLQVEYDLADSIDFHEWWAEGVGLIRREVWFYDMKSINESGDTIGVHNWSGSYELMADYFPTQTMAEFFPLHIDNWWQYLVEDWTINLDTSRYYETVRVTGTTSPPNGRTYKILQSERPGYSRLFRFDSATAMVMEYDWGPNNANEWPLYYFGLEPDSSWEGMRWDLCRGQSYGVQGFDNRYVQYLDMDTTQLVYRIYTAIFTDIQLRFAWGVGLVQERISGENPGIRRTLVAASVAGVEYGQYVNVERSLSLPARFVLHGAFPNPFNPATVIKYELPTLQSVTLCIYDLNGGEVIRLVDSWQSPGQHSISWNGKDQLGRTLPSGIYVARLITPEAARSIKMLLLK